MDKVVIKLTQKEYDTLVDINETGGIEVLDYEGEYQSLVDKGLVIVGSGRGPGNQWRRVVLTARGIGAMYAATYVTVLEG